ncbi:MAG: hypothetical protein QW085_00705 [Pyrobaculum sp.]|jgi:hypothetical protein
MSRAALYRKSEEQKRRYSTYGMFVVVFYLATLLIGAVIYSSSNLPVYLSINAAIASGGVVLFIQSLLVLLSYITLVAAAVLTFLSRSTTSRGEFTSSRKLLYASLIALGATMVFTTSALAPPAFNYIGGLLLIYVVLLVICIALAFYAIVLLKQIEEYYTPRRK